MKLPSEHKILIADDDSNIRNLIKIFLKKEGFKIVEAENGEETLEVIKREENISLVILDIHMPLLDGIETLKLIRKEYNVTDLPVIMFTARNEADFIVKTLDMGASDYITKPIKFKVLKARINNQLSRKDAEDEILKKNEQLEELNRRLDHMLQQEMQFVHFSNRMNKLEWNVFESTVKDMIGYLFNTDNFKIYFYNAETKKITSAKFNEKLKCFEKKEFEIPEDEKILEDVIEKEKVIYERDFYNSKYCIKKEDRNSNNRNAGIICSPLKFEEELIGLFYVKDIPNDNLKTQNIVTFRRMSNYVSMVVKNILLYQKIQEISIRDELTKLYNRRYLFEQLNREIELAKRKKQPLSLLMFDIDHFKDVNDTYGHAAGDIVLQGITEEIRNILRKTDIFCRYGGEEFIILLSSTGKKSAMTTAEKIRKCIEAKKIKIHNLSIPVTISLGVSECTVDDNTDSLLKKIDNALYSAKETGRNKCVLYGE